MCGALRAVLQHHALQPQLLLPPPLPACRFTNRCCPKKSPWSDHTAAFQTGSRLPGSCQGPRGADRNVNHGCAAAGAGGGSRTRLPLLQEEGAAAATAAVR